MQGHSDERPRIGLRQLLQVMIQRGASDLHITTNTAPQLRIDGSLVPLRTPPLDAVQTKYLCYEVMTEEQKIKFEKSNELDFSFGVKGLSRFRANVYMQRGAVAGAFRAIPFRIRNVDDLGLPPVISDLCELPRGLVLVTGPTGSGKSTTLAAMIDKINSEHRHHIVTIEDPIEYIHPDQLASVSQREVGLDTPDFATALRAALRQDPDAILVGEIRDEETMDIAMKAAETGHLVLSTLHTPDVARTIGRVLALSGEGENNEVRERFADNLRGIIAQRLLPRADGRGRVVAVEVLVVTGTARETIRRPEGALPLKDVMERGVHPYGMQTFEMALRDLVKNGLLDVDVARAALG